MGIEEIQKMAESVQWVCRDAKRSARDRLYDEFARSYKEIDTGLFVLTNYIVDCDGDLYFLENWAKEKTRYWGNHEVASVLYGEKDYAYTTARRIKLDGTLAKHETELVMVVDGWEDEEAGYLDYHFELDENGEVK